MTGSPLHRDTLALAGVLLEELEDAAGYPSLRRRLSQGALHLVDSVVLALAGPDRADHLVAADAELRTLRAHLLLALELGLFDEELYLSFAEQADTVGRQLGGWIKKLGLYREDRPPVEARA